MGYADDDELARAVDLFHTWQLDAAFELLQDLVASPLRMAALPSLGRATALRLYAEVARELGRLDLALPIADPLTQQCLSTWGPRHPVTLRATVCHATILHDLGRLERAEALYRTVLASAGYRRRHTARAMLIARAHLALIVADSGQPGSAIESLTQALSGLRQEFGRLDPHTIRITRHLAELHLTTGDAAVGRRLLTLARDAAATALGERHQVTRLLSADLAEVSARSATVTPQPAPRRRWREMAVWRRRPMRTAAVIAVAAAVTAVTVTVAVILGSGHGTSTPAAPPASAAAARPSVTPPQPPGDVRLAATEKTLTVTWVDPSGGQATPVVTVIIDGQRSSRSLPAGTQKYSQRGYPRTVTACVTVALLWPGPGTPQISPPTCT